jgi:hypothetical protein
VLVWDDPCHLDLALNATYVVRPGVHGNLMTGHVLLKENRGVGQATRADDEESREELLLGEVVQELLG